MVRDEKLYCQGVVRVQIIRSHGIDEAGLQLLARRCSRKKRTKRSRQRSHRIYTHVTMAKHLAQAYLHPCLIILQQSHAMSLAVSRDTLLQTSYFLAEWLLEAVKYLLSLCSLVFPRSCLPRSRSLSLSSALAQPRRTTRHPATFIL